MTMGSGSTKGKKPLKMIGNVLSAISIAFVIYAAYRLGFDISFVQNVPLFLVLCIVGVGLKMASVLCSASAWSTWLSFFSRTHVEKKLAIRAYGKANIGKYLPGNVMHFVERNLFASSLGLSQGRMALASVFEVLEEALTAVVISLFFASGSLGEIWNGLDEAAKSRVRIIGIVLLIVAVVGCVVLGRRYTDEIRSFARETTAAEVAKTFGKTFLFYVGSLSTLGVIMVMLYAYAAHTIPSLAVAGSIIAGYIVAWVVGFIVPGASGGVGVRELALTLLLSNVIGPELIVSLTVVHRLITIIGDFCVYLCVLAREKADK